MDGDRRPGRHDAGEATPQTALRVAKPTRVRLAWALGALAVIVVVATLLLILQARGAQLPPGFRTAGIVETLQFLGPAIVGAVLAARRPANPIGWLLLGLGLCFALYPLVVMYVTTALVVVPGGLPGVRWVAWVGNWIGCRPTAASRSCSCCFPTAGCCPHAGGLSPGAPSARPPCW